MKSKGMIFSVILPILVILGIAFLAFYNQNNSPEVTISFTPRQCVDTLWEIFYKEGSIQFIRAPTEEELIRVYYSLEQNIEIDSVERVNSSVTCSACEICNRDYTFRTTISRQYLNNFLNQGWMKV